MTVTEALQGDSLLRFFTGVKGRIVTFALVATLLPTLLLGWATYLYFSHTVREKVASQLDAASEYGAREIELWVKARHEEVRTFSTSDAITDGLETIGNAGSGSPGRSAAARRAGLVLRSIADRYADYQSLQVTDLSGQVVATTSPDARVTLAPDWLTRLADRPVVGTPVWDEQQRAPTITLAFPVRSIRSSRTVGALVAVVRMQNMEKVLASFPIGHSGEIHLIDAGGRRLLGSRAQPAGGAAAGAPRQVMAADTLAGLQDHPGVAREYVNADGTEVVGFLRRVGALDWYVVAEQDTDAVYAQVHQLRDLTVAMVLGLVLVVGSGAWIMGRSLVIPLDRLVDAANGVAGGDLDVLVPDAQRDELGHLSSRFNQMVGKLRENRDQLAAANEALTQQNLELEKLSITDGLTGLYNRKYLMDCLDRQFNRYARTGVPFSILMLDIDHFKRINDSYGHQTGDAVLVAMAKIYGDSIRAVDFAGRYGGEEFMLVLADTGESEAMYTAERIRNRVAGERYSFGRHTLEVTVSIGVAAVVGGADDANSLIARADAALYEAKRNGRNRVVRAALPGIEPPPPAGVTPLRPAGKPA